MVAVFCDGDLVIEELTSWKTQMVCCDICIHKKLSRTVTHSV
jgi:hypothetical protein